MKTMQRARGWAAAAAVFLAALMPSPAAMAEELSQAEQKPLQVLERTESGDLDPASVAERCVGYLSALKDAEKMRYVVVGLLQVRSEEALAAACEALIKATATGSYPAERFRAFALNEDPETNLLEYGRFMRAIFFAHYIEPASTAARASKP